MTHTLIVSYRSSSEKEVFVTENQSILNEYRIIWVNNTGVEGIRVDIMPDMVSV